MKCINRYFTGLFLVIFLSGFTAYSYPQDAKTDKQSKKEAKKAQRLAEFQSLDTLLNFRTYVLEASYLKNTYGSMIYVTSNLNFIRVAGYNGVLQTGSDTRIGSNNVGGVTAEGTINNYKIVKDQKRLTFTVTFYLLTNLGTFDILMNVSADNNATATITGSTSGKLTWSGRLVPLNKSRVFKGTNTI
jgi:hypothetical protein